MLHASGRTFQKEVSLVRADRPAVDCLYFSVNEFSVPASSLPRSDWLSVESLHFSVNKYPSLLNLPVSDDIHPVIGRQLPTRGGVNGFASLINCLSARILCV